jgi:hypothetical protein
MSILKKIIKEIFFNLQGGEGHNIGLTCNFAELILDGPYAGTLLTLTVIGDWVIL